MASPLFPVDPSKVAEFIRQIDDSLGQHVSDMSQKYDFDFVADRPNREIDFDEEEKQPNNRESDSDDSD